MHHRFRSVALVCSGCWFSRRPRRPRASKAAPKPKPVKGILLSLGDSYSVGWQELPGGTAGLDPQRSCRSAGAARCRPRLASEARQPGLRRSDDDLDADGIGGGVRPRVARPGAANYPNKSQTQAAVAFIKSHPNQVKVVTISIGGNDVDGCPTQSDPTGCVKANMPRATKNLTKIVKQLRAAGGKQMRIIGSTYPDVELGVWVHPTCWGRRPCRSWTVRSARSGTTSTRA